MSALALSRRGFMAGISTLAGSFAIAGPALALPSAEQQHAQLMDRLWAEQRRRFPELAAPFAGGPGVQPDLPSQLGDWSRDSRRDWVGWARSALRRIAAIDATALPQATEVNRAILLDHFGKIAAIGGRHAFGAAPADSGSPVAPYAISPATGPHRAIPALLIERHTVAMRADGEAWLGRLGAFARALDDATLACHRDAALGVIPPAWALDGTLVQLAALRQPQPLDHPLVLALAERTSLAGLPGNWRDRAAHLIASSVYPALDRQVAALTALRAAAPDPAGAWTLPQGQQYFADALGWHTGTTLSPEEAHALGRDQVAHISAEMDGLLVQLGLATGTVGERLQTLARRPGEALPAGADGRAAALTAVSTAIERIRPRLPDLFAVPAPARLEVQPLPAPLAAQRAEACLLGGDLSGTRPDTLYVNLNRLDAWPRYCIASTAFHASIPARLWEGAAALSAEELPALRKCGMRYAACADGWSLYAEQVADEQGYYAGDPASRLGHLRTRLIHAARLVADTGLNAQRWTLEQVTAYLAETTGQDRAALRGEAETMALLPGSASAHAVGQAEWLRLRALARRVAGPGFDQRRFHQLIQFGGAPFAVIEDLVTTTFTRRLSVLKTRAV